MALAVLTLRYIRECSSSVRGVGPSLLTTNMTKVTHHKHGDTVRSVGPRLLTTNMLAIQCSKPIAAKAEMGSQMPTNLPVKSCVWGAIGDYMTRHSYYPPFTMLTH
jgi:hypothetical protein